MQLKAVEKLRPDDCAVLAEGLHELADRAATGEFKAAFMVLICTEGGTYSCRRGASVSCREALGMIEIMKYDMLKDTDDAPPPSPA